MKKTDTYRRPFTYGLLILTCVISACQKQINTRPITEYSFTNFWNEPVQASAALNGAYNYLQTAFKSFVYYGEGRSDNLILDVDNNNTAVDVINNTLDPNMGIADWGDFYKVIKQANLIMQNVEIMKEKGIYGEEEGNMSEYKRVLGQAYGLRALCYFYMVRLWGAVPLITKPVKNNGNILEYRTPRTDTAAIYKQIESDLDSARALLPSSYSNAQATRAQLTRGAIDAIFTDYYMWQNKMDSVLLYSSLVIGNSNYTLAKLYDPNVDYFNNPDLIDNTEYAKMFYQGFSQESIFEISFDYEAGTTSSLTYYFGFAGQSLFKASSHLMDKFETNDLRLVVDFKSDVQIRKYFEKVGFDKTKENDKNIILYRLSGIMLLRAEARNATGNREAAFILVNDIRKRAGIDPIPPEVYNNFTRSEAEAFILDERARELCFEGKRWFDLVRTGRAIPVMGPINGLKDPGNILWPISLDVIRENPKIEQNSYYK